MNGIGWIMSNWNVVEQNERLILRYPIEKDRTEYMSLRRASAEFHQPWEPNPPKERVDPNGLDLFDRVWQSCDTERRKGLLVVRKIDKMIIGAFNMNEIVRGVFQSCYLGYWIGTFFSRQGYMTEALALGLRFAFLQLKLHRVEANIIPRNVASKALVQRLGFRKEGLFKRYLRIAGNWEDHERWALTFEEYEPSLNEK